MAAGKLWRGLGGGYLEYVDTPTRRKPLTRKAAKDGFLATFGLGALLSMVTSDTSIHGWWWTGVRTGVAVLWVLYGLAWLEAARRKRQHR